MSVVGAEYLPDLLYERVICPWTLVPSEWPKAREDWERVDAIVRLPWAGRVLDFGAADGTLAALVASRNPHITRVECVETDENQRAKGTRNWEGWPMRYSCAIPTGPYSGALCCEVLEHMDAQLGQWVLGEIKDNLKKGGMLCVTVPLKGGSREVYPGHIRSFTLADIVAEVRRAGFTVDERATRTILDIWAMVVADA
jgi:2-polyprenyl-3-methyl-5-hydroxy-6-metoxy-1,4-benzoquinol methylase